MFHKHTLIFNNAAIIHSQLTLLLHSKLDLELMFVSILQNDKPVKTLMYMEAVLSFIQCGYAMEKEAISEPSLIQKMYMQTFNLIT